MGTGVNLRLLIDFFLNTKRNDGLCAIFIDFKSAYNTVPRERIFKLLKDKNILEHDEVDFLKFLHE